MANGSEVIFTGIRDTERLLAEGTKFALRELGITGASQAKLLAPVDQGQLRNSIQWKIANGQTGGLNDSEGETASGKLNTPPAGTAYVGSTANYAIYQEFGTRYQPPQPYLRPSIALLAGDTPEIVKEKMDEEWKKGPLKYGQERVKF